MKVKNRISDCYITVTVKCDFKEKISLDEIQAMEQHSCKGLMKLKDAKKKKATYLGIKAIPLIEKLTNTITKYEFFLILEQFLLVISNCEKMNIPVNGILYNLKNVYFTEATKEIQLLYCPFENNCKAVPMDFIESLIYSSVPAQENDMEYITRFAYFLKTVTSFNVKKFESYIASEEPRVLTFFGIEDYNEKIAEKPNIEKTTSTKSEESLNSRIVGREPIDISKTNQIQQTARMNEDKTLYSDDDDTLYGEEDDDRTLVDDEDDDTLMNDDETEMINKEKTEFSKYPFLIRVSTGESIKITKPVFRVGIKIDAVDYVVLNNNTVSRSHADIICKNDKYYIYDLESKNKTYVNERVIPSKTEIEIKNSDRIKLSNEEFIFNA